MINNKISVVAGIAVIVSAGSTRADLNIITYGAMEIAQYHNLGKSPEPQISHEFC
jgi:hypothetical protein